MWRLETTIINRANPKSIMSRKNKNFNIMKKSYLILLVACSLFFTKKTYSQIEPFIGQIILVAFNYEPQGWAFCDGRTLQIAQYNALYSLLGTTYGGNGTTTFALPDLRGRVAVGIGQRPGSSIYPIGTQGGTENNTLTVAQLPAHNHTVNAVATDGNNAIPTGALPANTKTLDPEYSNGTGNTTMRTTMIGFTGSGQSVQNMQPYISLNYIIALEGIYPSR